MVQSVRCFTNGPDSSVPVTHRFGRQNMLSLCCAFYWNHCMYLLLILEIHNPYKNWFWNSVKYFEQMSSTANINVWFPFMYSQKWNSYFQNRIIMFCLPVPTLVYLWAIYIFPGSVCLFCCREICGPILGIYKMLTDTWMWKLGLRPRNSQKRNT